MTSQNFAQRQGRRRLHRISLTWKEIEEFRALCRVPVVLKGILHPDDADEAVNAEWPGSSSRITAAATSTTAGHDWKRCRRSSTKSPVAFRY